MGSFCLSVATFIIILSSIARTSSLLTAARIFSVRSEAAKFSLAQALRDRVTLPAMSSSSNQAASDRPLFVDIGANLLDERYRKGEYHGKQRHEPDWEQVMKRAEDIGVTHIILTAGTLKESTTDQSK